MKSGDLHFCLITGIALHCISLRCVPVCLTLFSMRQFSSSSQACLTGFAKGIYLNKSKMPLINNMNTTKAQNSMVQVINIHKKFRNLVVVCKAILSLKRIKEMLIATVAAKIVKECKLQNDINSGIKIMG